MLINMPCYRSLAPLVQIKSSLPAKVHMYTSGGALKGRPIDGLFKLPTFLQVPNIVSIRSR